MNTNEMLERRARLLGVGAPLFYDEPVHIVRGEGVWLYDADGKKYLDVYNNVPNVGHSHPHVVEALCKQSKLLNVHTRYLHDFILDYVERLTSLHDDSLTTTFITCSGTEANELALRMARFITGGQGIICSNATYHGNSEAVDELGTIFSEGKSKVKRVKAIPYPESYRPISDAEGEALADAYANEVKKAIDEFKEEGIGFAGILLCPIFANEGLPNVPAGYMQKAIQHVRDAGGLYIADEVQAGFARTGSHMWGYQVSGVAPDIATMGKPMGNGHPLAGLVVGVDLANAFRKEVMYFNTFGGNPVQCAVGMAVLDVIENEKLLDNSFTVGEYVREGLRRLQNKHDLIGDVRGHGLFNGAELVKDRTSKEGASKEAAHIVNEMKERGVLLGKIGVHDNILKMRPPLPFSKVNADQLLSTLDDVMAGV
jgi:4-aminobutyrate aminotransferase-like enzyme